MTNDIIKLDDIDKEIAEQEEVDSMVEIWRDQQSGASIAELATKYAIAPRTVSYRLRKAKELFAEQLEKQGKKLFAEFWDQYQTVADEVLRDYRNNRDPALLAQWRGIKSDQRKLLSMDKASKAPVNEDGKVVPERLIFIMNDENYKNLEKKYDESKTKIIDNEG